MNHSNEHFEMTSRGKVSEQLRTLWKKSRNTEPDENAISEALDQTQAGANNQQWFTAKAFLDL